MRTRLSVALALALALGSVGCGASSPQGSRSSPSAVDSTTVDSPTLSKLGGCEYTFFASDEAETLVLTVRVDTSIGNQTVGGSDPSRPDESQWDGTVERGDFLLTGVCDDQLPSGEDKIVRESIGLVGDLKLDGLPEDFESCEEYEYGATLSDATFTPEGESTVELGDVRFTTFFWGCNVAG